MMSGLRFELLTSKKQYGSTAEFEGTGWVWELELLTFNGSGWSIAEFEGRSWISEPESFTFSGNSNWAGFSFVGLYLLNDNLVYELLILVVDYMEGWLIFLMNVFWKL